MKKKFSLFLSAIALAASVSAAVLSSWVKVSDPKCNKCVMNDYTRKCGLCGGFMEGVPGTESVEDNNYIKADYRCKKCQHTITYKNR